MHFKTIDEGGEAQSEAQLRGCQTFVAQRHARQCLSVPLRVQRRTPLHGIGSSVMTLLFDPPLCNVTVSK